MVEAALTQPKLQSVARALDPGPVAVGTWSGGRFMHFGEPLDDERFTALITPDDCIRTVMTADVYGAGEADRMLGRAHRRNFGQKYAGCRRTLYGRKGQAGG